MPGMMKLKQAQVAAADLVGTKLWCQHLNQLLRIIRLRSERYGPERHEHIVWWVFAIDVHSVLTGSGNGDFAEYILRIRPLSPPAQHRRAIDARRYSIPRFPGNEPGSLILEFHRKILTITARLGLLARDLRAEYTRAYRLQSHTRNQGAMRRQQRVLQLRDVLRRTWRSRVPNIVAMGYSNESIPVEARGIFEHVSRVIRG